MRDYFDFITPQLSYSVWNFTVYAKTDLPLYQYIYTSQYYTQVGSEYTTTVGISYRFFSRSNPKELKDSGLYADSIRVTIGITVHDIHCGK